jgi:hypothetical protein
MRWFLNNVLLISSVCNLIFISVKAQNAPVTRMASFRNLTPGQLVSFPVNITGFNNIGSISLSCDYDNSALNFVSAEINPAIANGGLANVGDNDLGNGNHRLRFGWYGTGISLPDNSWIVKYIFRYISGNPSIKWFDNGGSCSYTDPAGVFLNDIPTTSYFVDGNICSGLLPGPINGPVSVYPGSTNVIYSIEPLQNIINYTWSVPFGAFITKGIDSNSITVEYHADAISGNITVNGTDRCGSGPVSSLAVTLDNTTVGIGQHSDTEHFAKTDNGFLIYPNPAKDFFIVKSEKPISKSLILSIFSSRGELSKKIMIRTGNLENDYIVDVTGIVPGIYFILIESEPMTVLKKLIIK